LAGGWAEIWLVIERVDHVRDAPAEGPEPVWGQHVADTEYGPTSAVTLYHTASKFMLKFDHRADFVTAALEDQRNSFMTERGTLRFEVIADEEMETVFT